MAKSEEKCKEVLETYRELAKETHDSYLPHVAMTLNNLAVLQYKKKRIDKIRRELQRSPWDIS